MCHTGEVPPVGSPLYPQLLPLSYYPGDRIKRGLRINVTDICFIDTNTAEYSLKPTERNLTLNSNLRLTRIASN